jgi:hypothetical protein
MGFLLTAPETGALPEKYRADLIEQGPISIAPRKPSP